MSHIIHIEIDDSNLPPPTPEIEQERKVAIFDLLESNVFELPPRQDRATVLGPYRLDLFIRDKRLVFDISTDAGEKAAEFHLSLSPFRQVVKDYWSICKSYFDAVKHMPPSQIETIDMAWQTYPSVVHECVNAETRNESVLAIFEVVVSTM